LWHLQFVITPFTAFVQQAGIDSMGDRLKIIKITQANQSSLNRSGGDLPTMSSSVSAPTQTPTPKHRTLNHSGSSNNTNNQAFIESDEVLAHFNKVGSKQ
jgi:hypothetical protein